MRELSSYEAKCISEVSPGMQLVVLNNEAWSVLCVLGFKTGHISLSLSELLIDRGGTLIHIRTYHRLRGQTLIMSSDVGAVAFVENFRNISKFATQSIDVNVEKAIPPGLNIVDFAPHGNAWWSKTLLIITTRESGAPRKFLSEVRPQLPTVIPSLITLKINHTAVGKQNLIGEFESLKAIHDLMPDFVPEPIAYGSYASMPDVHFLLMDYLNLTGDVPSIDTLPAKLAEMHQKGVSPNGKFGFYVPTGLPFLHGEFEQKNTWPSCWEQFFTEMYVRIFHWEQKLHGPDEEMQILFKSMIEKVI